MAKRVSTGGNIRASELNGIALYQEKKRTVYYDVFTKNGYIINNTEARTYLMYSARYSGSALIAFLVYYLTNNLLISVAVGLVLVAILEVVFRKAFLYKLPEIKNYQHPTKPGYVEESANTESYFKLVLLILAGFAMAVMMGINAKSADFNLPTKIVAYIVMYGSLLLSVLNTMALVKKIKNR